LRRGQQIHARKYAFKVREGFSLDEVRIPARIPATPSPVRGWNEQFLRSVLEHLSRSITASLDPR
jgi:hypothetical protein